MSDIKPCPDGIHRSTWTMIVIISDVNDDGEFYVELEDPRYSGPSKVIDREVFKVGESFTGWIGKASRRYLNRRAKDLHRANVIRRQGVVIPDIDG